MANKTAGRTGRRWTRLKAEVRARRGPCCRCGLSIDYTLAYPDPRSFTVDHYPHPLATHPHLAEDPANLAAAHFECNSKAGGQDRAARHLARTNEGLADALGDTSGMW